jgi:hypothetical protein
MTFSEPLSWRRWTGRRKTIRGCVTCWRRERPGTRRERAGRARPVGPRAAGGPPMNWSNSIRARRRSTAGSNAGPGRTKRVARRVPTSSPRAGGSSGITAWRRDPCCTQRRREESAATCPIRCPRAAGTAGGRPAMAGQGARRGAAARCRPPGCRRCRGDRRARSARARDFRGGEGLLRALGLPSLSDRADDADDHDRGSAKNARGNPVTC